MGCWHHDREKWPCTKEVCSEVRSSFSSRFEKELAERRAHETAPEAGSLVSTGQVKATKGKCQGDVPGAPETKKRKKQKPQGNGK